MRPGIFWLLALASPSLLFLVYLYQLHQLEQYHYYPALLIAVGVLLWTRWDRRIQFPDSLGAVFVLALALVFLVAGIWLWSPWLGAIAAVLIFAVFCVVHKERNGSSLFALWFLALILIRLPINLDQKLTTWLQTKTASLTSYLLDSVQVPNRLTGHVFHLASGELFVETACSGVQSVFTLLFCAVLIVVWYRRSIWALPIYAMAAVSWAGAMNILRVFVIAYAQERYGINLSHGWSHSLLGYACLAIAILLLLSTDRLLRIVLYPVREESTTEKCQNPVVAAWNWLFDLNDGKASRAIAVGSIKSPANKLIHACSIALLVLMVLTIAPQVWGAVRTMRNTIEYAGTQYWQPSESTVRDVASELVVSKYENFPNQKNPALGEHAHVWTCSLDDVGVRIVVSQYPDIHDLCECYHYNGWELKKRRDSKPSSTDWQYSSANFGNSDALNGYLIFSTMNADGSPRSHNDLQTVLKNRFMDSRTSTHTINVQFWVTAETPLSDETIEKLEQIHLKVRNALREQLLLQSRERS